MPPDPLRVVVAEDNYLVREGVRRLLEASNQVRVVAAVGTAQELLDAVRRLQPDAVLTDIRMPPAFGTEGIEAAHAIRAEAPDVGIVVLSQYADPGYALQLLEHGAAGLGYLLKDRIGDTEQLIQALHDVIGGRSVIDPDIVTGLVARQARAERSPLGRLTPREMDVLRAMAQGGTNAGIAHTLSLSESAVEKHVNSIFLKLGLTPESKIHRRVAAVVTYLRSQHPDDLA